jgi:hypothetical protein
MGGSEQVFQVWRIKEQFVIDELKIWSGEEEGLHPTVLLLHSPSCLS